MCDLRETARRLLLLACTALLAGSGCVIAYHDGLPAWTPPAGRAEGSIGGHWVSGSGSGVSNLWYLTPGFRFGLPRLGSLAADLGLSSVVTAGDGGYTAVLGPVLGIGYQRPSFGFVVRGSMYLVGFGTGGTAILGPNWQVALLAGNGGQPDRTHISGGLRGSVYGAGPILLLDRDVGPVNLRVEGSYMLPYEGWLYGPHSDGQVTLGLTAATAP